MSSKAFLIASALAVTGSAAFAQGVVSQNIVGYVNVNSPKGFSIIANQLDNGKGNKVSDLIPTAPLGTTLYKFVNGAFALNSNDGEAWDNPNDTLAPGEAAFINNPDAALKLTFVGDVKLGSQTVALKKGFSLVSVVVPQELAVKDLGLPAELGDTVYQFTTSFSVNSNDGEAWDNPDNKVKVGEGFFVLNAQAADKNWTRVFNAN
jgi:hypothetical protein